MAIFYTKPAAADDLAKVLQDALATDPKSVTNVADRVKELAGRLDAAKPSLSWARVGVAGGVLVVVLIAGLYAVTVPALDAWNKVLLHAFGVLLGLLVGFLGGERSSAE